MRPAACAAKARSVPIPSCAVLRSPEVSARLSGRYNSGKPWKTDYAFELSGDGKTMTMTSDTDIAEVSIYTKSAIPEAYETRPRYGPPSPADSCDSGNLKKRRLNNQAAFHLPDRPSLRRALSSKRTARG